MTGVRPRRKRLRTWIAAGIATVAVLGGTVAGVLVVPEIVESYSPHPVSGTEKYAARAGGSAAWLTPSTGWTHHQVLGSSALTLVSPDEALVIEVSLRDTTADEVFAERSAADGDSESPAIVEETLDSGLTLRRVIHDHGFLIAIDTKAGLVVVDAKVGTAVEIDDYLPALGALLDTLVAETRETTTGSPE
jgi:hypothetical protein